MPSSWSDLARPPLSQRRLRRVLVGGGLWQDVRVVEETASTNADVAAAARRGAPEGVVIIAERQTAGRGRLDRQWESPARAGVLLSVLFRPRIAPAALTLLPLVAGLSMVEAVRSVAGLEARLKWPNDVLVDDRKLGGILLERVGDAVVVGVGLNVTTRRDELPVAGATSVALEDGRTDREPLVKEVLRSLARRYQDFVGSKGSATVVMPAYREVCATIGRHVVVTLPGDARVEGAAVDVDDAGRLVVQGADGVARPWSAGDVVHVR